MTDITALARKAEIAVSKYRGKFDCPKSALQDWAAFEKAATPAAWIDLAERLEKAEARET